MVKAAVDGLNDLASLVEPLKESGRRHITYGVKKEDFVKVLRSFVKTLREALPNFGREDEIAWVKALTIVSDVMCSVYPQQGGGCCNVF